MDAYNAVAGIDEKALNLFISGFYGCGREHVFHRVVSVADKGLEPLTSLEFNVTATPRVGFLPGLHAPAGSTVSSFELWVDHFTVTLHYSGTTAPTQLAGTLHATADLVSDAPGGVLVPRLTAATLNIEGEQKLSEVFNNVVSPHLDAFLQEKLLDPIRVPPLKAGEVTLNGPAVVTSDDRLLISAAVSPAQAAPAPLHVGWPTGVVFVAADFALVNALAKLAVAKMGPQTGEWKKTIKFGIGQSTIKAVYSGTVIELVLAPVSGQPTQIEGTATIAASMTAKAKSVFDVSGSGTAKATVTTEAVANKSGGVGVRLTGIKPFSLRFSMSGPAGGFAKYVETVGNAASGVLHDAISANLQGLPPLEVGRFLTSTCPSTTRTYVIQIKEPAHRTMQVRVWMNPRKKTASNRPTMRAITASGTQSAGSSGRSVPYRVSANCTPARSRPRATACRQLSIRIPRSARGTSPVPDRVHHRSDHPHKQREREAHEQTRHAFRGEHLERRTQ